MIIDAHAHYLPGSFPERDGFPRMTALTPDTARELTFGAASFRAADVFFDVERRLEAMDAGGVNQEIISPMPPLLNFSLETSLATSVFRWVNEFGARCAESGEGRIHALGAVPLQDPDAATAELALVAESGLRGVEVGSHIDGVPIGDPRFIDFFREADRLRLIVFVHTLPRADEAALPAHLRGSIGVGIEGARGAASLAFGGTAENCSLDRIIFSHAAGGLPLMLARADYFWENQDAGTRQARKPSEIAKRFSYDSMLFDPRGLQFVVDYLGADRVVLGTDFPAMPRPRRLASLIDALTLSGEAYEAIAGGNVQRLLAEDAADLEPAGIGTELT